jgi:hypothetical protein
MRAITSTITTAHAAYRVKAMTSPAVIGGRDAGSLGAPVGRGAGRSTRLMCTVGGSGGVGVGTPRQYEPHEPAEGPVGLM